MWILPTVNECDEKEILIQKITWIVDVYKVASKLYNRPISFTAVRWGSRGSDTT
jgi:hypothetical protein